MNQAVVQMYLLILVGVLAVVLAVRPRWPGPRRRWLGFARFAGVAAVGAAAVIGAFHTAGRVDQLAIAGESAFVLETFPDRSWSEAQWTELSLESGQVRSNRVPPAEAASPAPASAGSLEVPRTLRGRLRRPVPDSAPIEIGPELDQPVLAAAGPGYAVVSAFDTVYEPESVYLARFGPDGALEWRLDKAAFGLHAGRLRRAARLSGGDALLVFEGVAADRSLFARLTLDTHVVAVRLDVDGGDVRWTRVF